MWVTVPIDNSDYIAHHGIMGQKWGKKNGPPYPLSDDVSTGKRLKESEETNKKEKEEVEQEKRRKFIKSHQKEIINDISNDMVKNLRKWDKNRNQLEKDNYFVPDSQFMKKSDSEIKNILSKELASNMEYLGKVYDLENEYQTNIGGIDHYVDSGWAIEMAVLKKNGKIRDWWFD